MAVMTNGNSLSKRPPRARAHAVRAVEAAFRDLHERLRAAQREAEHLEQTRESAVEEALETLGADALGLDRDSLVRIEWLGDDAADFEARLRAEIDDIGAALGEFLDGGDFPAGLPTTVRRKDVGTGEIWASDVAESLGQIRADLNRTKHERSAQAGALRSECEDSWRRAVEALRAWASHPNRPVSDEWGRIQIAWRTALGLPGHTAAEILGVSAPAITRYEKGARSPARAYVESMVERVISHGIELPSEAAAIFRLAETFETPAADLLETFETHADHEHEIRESLASLVDSLPIDDVTLLLAIATSPEALSALRSLSTNDELAPLRQAIGALGGWDA